MDYSIPSRLTGPPDERQYAGLSYEASSRKGLALIKRAAETQDWKYLPEHLAVLRLIMRHELPAKLEEASRSEYPITLKSLDFHPNVFSLVWPRPEMNSIGEKA